MDLEYACKKELLFSFEPLNFFLVYFLSVYLS